VPAGIYAAVMAGSGQAVTGVFAVLR